MKTIEQWFEELPDGYRERAIANTDEKRLGLCEDSLANAITGAFVWENTTEDRGFWHDVHQWAEGLGELPPLPDEQIKGTEMKNNPVPEESYQSDLQAFKMALDCIQDLESLYLGNSDDLELVYKIAAIIATEGDINMKQLQTLKNETYDR